MAPVPSLLVLPRHPHPGTGTGQRSLLLLEAAARLGPVHVVLLDGGGPVADLERRDDVASVSVLHSDLISPRGRWRQRLLGPLRLVSPGRAYRADPALRRALLQKVAETGARLVLFRYARIFCAAGLKGDDGPAILVDVDDRDDQKYASRLARKFGGRVPAPIRSGLRRLAETLRRRLADATLVWFAAEEDAWPLEETDIRILANAPHSVPKAPPPMAESSRTVLFVGTHVHEPNRDGMNWFLDNCWAVLRERCPGAGLRIVGQGDWAALGAGRGHLSGVDYVGRVDDLAAEYAAARVCICPVREGGGSKIKLIEAAGFGRPIVSTSHALRGFDAEISGHAAAADAPEDFVAACAHYLEDADLAAASGAALRKAQQAHHSRAAALDRIAADMDRALVRQAELSGRSAGT